MRPPRLLDISRGFRAMSYRRLRREFRPGSEPSQARQPRNPVPRRRPTRCPLRVEPLESRALLSAGGGPRSVGVRAPHAAAEVRRVPLSQDPNPPWYPSLLAFEHHDSARTHLFAQARFGGSFSGPNRVQIRASDPIYTTPYNTVDLGPKGLFVYGGAYGDKGGTGSFVARVNPKTLQPIWQTQLIDTAATGEWNYPGVLSVLNNDYLYLIYGYRLAKIDPRNGRVLAQVELPTPVAPRDTTYNGLDALPDGTLIAQAIYRAPGSSFQGSLGLLYPDTSVPSEVVAVDPHTLRVVAATLAPEF